MKNSNIRLILICIIEIVFSISCSPQYNEKMQMDMEVYYVLKDSFFGMENKCRVLIRIPKENNVTYDTGKNIILCLKNEKGILNFSHIFNGEKKDNEFYLRTTVVGIFKNKEVSLEPSFSPISIKENQHETLDYIKGKTIVLAISVKSNKNKYIEFIDMKPKCLRIEEPVRVK